MPAPKYKADRLLDSRQIAETLSCSRRQAYEVLAMFEQRGEAFRDGKLIRVPEKAFARYVSDHIGKESVS